MIAVYFDDIKECLKNVDYLFCNEDESSEWAKKHDLDASDRQGIAKLVASGEKTNTQRPRVVIMT